MNSDEQLPLIGERYRPVRKIDRRRGSVVWEAEDTDTAAVVHVKVLREHLRSEPLVVMRFRREYEIAHRLDHPALVAAKDLVDDGDQLALVYDRPVGETAAERLGDEGPIDPTRLALLLEPLLAGLEHAHRRGIVHRNLSLRTLWFGDEPDRDEVAAQVTGFGGARILDMVGLTTHSTAFGMSYYRAPEQLRGESSRTPVDRRCDVWSMGVILFELVTGQPPVDAAGPRQMLSAWEDFDAGDALEGLADTPVGEVIASCLVVDPDRRASSPRGLRDILAGAAAHTDTATVPEGPTCWRCEKPRIDGFDYCFDCGAEPIITSESAGEVELYVPKFRREDPTMYSGLRNVQDLFVRRYEPGLDIRRRGIIHRRLLRAGGHIGPGGQRRMQKSPFRIADGLTRRQAFRLGEFLRYGEDYEPVSHSRPPRLDNPDRFHTEAIPVLYRYPKSDRPLLNTTPFWSMAGISWSSPLFNASAVLVIVAGIAGCITVMPFPGEVGWGTVPWLLTTAITVLFWLGPIAGVLWRRSKKQKRSVVGFPAPGRDYQPHREWHRVVRDLQRDCDRRLARRVLYRGREGLSKYDADPMAETMREIRDDFELLARSGGGDEWARLQTNWESLRAVERHGEGDPGTDRTELAEEIARHERREAECDLARARILDRLERLDGVFDSGATLQSSVSNRDRAASRSSSEIELSVLSGDEVRESVDDLERMHEAFLEVENEAVFDIPEVSPEEELRLDVELPRRFEPVSRLGGGGMAEVVLVEDRRRDERVALKIAHPHLAGDPVVSRLFEREFEAVRRIDHPRVVSMYEHLTVDGADALLMEYVDGVDLATSIRWREKLPVGEVRKLGGQLLEALEAAHRRGVVHGDVKPANAMVDDDGELVLIDFGLARMEAVAASTELESQLGTPGYAAPEILERGLVDERADIYGVAVTLFEAVTGRLPFTSDGALKTRRGEWGQWIDDRRLCRILQRAAAPDPRERFESADRMRAALSDELKAGAKRTRRSAMARCHNCGERRISHLTRCFECGARRRAVARGNDVFGKMVVLQSVAGDNNRDRGFLTAEDVEEVEGVVDEYPNLEAADNFSEVLARFPVLLTETIDRDDAEAITASLRRHGLKAKPMNPTLALLYVIGQGIPRIFANAAMLAAFAPVIIAVVFGLALDIGAALLVEGHDGLFGVAWLVVLLILGVTFTLGSWTLSGRLRPVTNLSDVGGETASQSLPWEKRAFEAYQTARSTRSRQLLKRLIGEAAELREAWVDDVLRAELVESLDDVVDRLLSEYEELLEAEQVVAEHDPVKLSKRLRHLDESTGEDRGARAETGRRQLERRLEVSESARRQVIEIGAKLLRVCDRFDQMKNANSVEDDTGESTAMDEILADLESTVLSGASEKSTDDADEPAVAREPVDG